jgi:hypothetical protein
VWRFGFICLVRDLSCVVYRKVFVEDMRGFWSGPALSFVCPCSYREAEHLDYNDVCARRRVWMDCVICTYLISKTSEFIHGPFPRLLLNRHRGVQSIEFLQTAK